MRASFDAIVRAVGLSPEQRSGYEAWGHLYTTLPGKGEGKETDIQKKERSSRKMLDSRPTRNDIGSETSVPNHFRGLATKTHYLADASEK